MCISDRMAFRASNPLTPHSDKTIIIHGPERSMRNCGPDDLDLHPDLI